MYFFAKGMMKRCALLLPILFYAGTSVSAQQSKTDKTILSIEKNKVDNSPVSITFSQNANWKASQAQEIFRKYLGIDGVDTKMQLLYSTTTKMKITSDRYTEYYKGIKITAGSFTLMSKDGRVGFMTGNYYSVDNSVSCLLYTSPSPRDRTRSRMPSSA